eukprot:191218_1
MFEKKLLECLDMLPYPQRWQEFLTGPGDCFKYTVSKCLGYGIIAGSFLLKVPQLINIYRSRSAKGVSSLTYAGETLCYLIGLFYNMRMAFPFSTYGENVALSIQNILVLVMMFVYAEKQVLKCFTMLAFFSSISYAMLNVLTIESLSYLVGCNIAFAALAKLPQIYVNFASKSTGQLSLPTTALQFGGCVARVFTTIQEVSDPLILCGFIVGAALNSIIVGQIVFYKRAPVEKKKQ